MSPDNFLVRKPLGTRYGLIVRHLLLAALGVVCLATMPLPVLAADTSKTPTSSKSSKPKAIVHTIAKGETIYALSRKYGVSVQAILNANPGVKATSLKIGQKLNIPPKASAKVSKPTKPVNPTGLKDSAKKDLGATKSGKDTKAADKLKDPPKDSKTSTAKTDSKKDASKDSKSDKPPKVHVVAKGDSLWKIARSHNVTVKSIQEANKLKGNVIHIGQKLKIPSSVFVPKHKTTNKVAKVVKPKPSPKPKRIFLEPVIDLIKKPKVRKNRWKLIVIHMSGTRSGNAKIFDYYHRRVKKWSNGLAYHFVIGNGTESGDGEIEIGERWRKQIYGGHVRSQRLNEISIGICLVGDFNSHRPTKKQIASLIELITFLRKHPPGTKPARVDVHKLVNPTPTTCPGKYFPTDPIKKLFAKR